MKTIGRNLAVVSAIVVISWLIAVIVTGVITGFGEKFRTVIRFSDAPATQTFAYNDTRVEVRRSAEYISIELFYETAGQQFRLTKVTALSDGLRLELWWDHSPTAADGLVKVGRVSERQGELIVYGFTSSHWFAPYSREVVSQLSAGALGAWFRTIFASAYNGIDADVKDNELRTIAGIAASALSASINLREVSSRGSLIALWSGRIQFLTLCLAISALLAKVAHRQLPEGSSSGLLELVPFSGFLGTLIGMSTALLLLGDVDLSNDDAKSISLGAIGAALGRAIDTTKFAIAAYGLVILVILVAQALANRTEKLQA